MIYPRKKGGADENPPNGSPPDEAANENEENKESKDENPDKSKSVPMPLRNTISDIITEEEVKQNRTCFICAEAYAVGDHCKTLKCGHYFHTECIIRWVKVNCYCPECKRKIRARMPEGFPVSPEDKLKLLQEGCPCDNNDQAPFVPPKRQSCFTCCNGHMMVAQQQSPPPEKRCNLSQMFNGDDEDQDSPEGDGCC